MHSSDQVPVCQVLVQRKSQTSKDVGNRSESWIVGLWQRDLGECLMSKSEVPVD